MRKQLAKIWGRIKRRPVIAFAVSVLLFVLLLWVSRYEKTTLACEQCLMYKDQFRLRIAGVTVFSNTGDMRPDPLTETYYELVGGDHEHDWLEFSRAVTAWQLPFTAVTFPQDGAENESRIVAIGEALELVKRVAHWDRQERIALYDAVKHAFATTESQDEFDLGVEILMLRVHGSEKDIGKWLVRHRAPSPALPDEPSG